MPPSTLSKALRRLPFSRRSQLGAGRPFWAIDGVAPAPAGDFIALAPGAEAPLLHLALPEALRGTAREAVARHQLRNRLGGGVERLDMRPAALPSGNLRWSAMVAADREALARWRAAVARAPGRCLAILPDYLALPAAQGLWTVAAGERGESVRVRLELGDGFSAEPALAALMLERALERARSRGNLPAAVLRLGPPSPEVDAVLTGLPVVRDVAALPAGIDPPETLARGEAALDLGRDPAALVTTLEARLRAVRLPLALALAGFAAWAVALELDTRRALARADALTEANVAAVRRDFLPSGPLLDIPVQVTREIERRQNLGAAPVDEATPLARLRLASAIIADEAVRLDEVALQADGTLVLDLTLSGFSALDRLAEALAEAGLAARVARSGTETDGQVSATVALGSEQ